MALKAIVKADHTTKTATLSFIDEATGFSPIDSKGQEFRNMTFPYSHLTDYDFMFDPLGVGSDGLERYHFKLLNLNP